METLVKLRSSMLPVRKLGERVKNAPKQDKTETNCASENVLAKDWLTNNFVAQNVSISEYFS